MKKMLSLMLLIAVPLLMGMGSLAGTAVTDTIPRPEKNFSALILDQLDVATECRGISIEGKTFLDGKRGKGAYVIHFEEIDKVYFFKKGETLTARITLRKNGDPLELTVDADRRLYGKTGWGIFQIGLGDVKSLQILGLTGDAE